MLPSEGLIYTFRGQIGLAVFLLIVGAVACIVLTLMLIVRKAPPLTTQTNLETGVKEHGVGRWFLVFAVITCGPQVGFIFVRTLVEGVDRLIMAGTGWWPLILLGLALVAVGLVAVKVWRTRPKVPVVEPLSVGPTRPQPAPMWSAPLAGQWDDPEA
jgi:hypothetical protein